MKSTRSGTVKVDADAAIVDPPTNGVVEYIWTAEDVDTAGTFLAEWEVTFPGGKIQTFPNDGHVKVIIVEDLA